MLKILLESFNVLLMEWYDFAIFSYFSEHINTYLDSSIDNLAQKIYFFGFLSSLGGYYLAVWINGSIAGAMATVAGLQFFLVWAMVLLLKQKSRSSRNKSMKRKVYSMK